MIEPFPSKEEVTKQVRLFRDFLVVSWPYLDKLMENHDWDNDMDFSDDWLQVNWELLVERELLGKNKHIAPLSVPMGTRVIDRDAHLDYAVTTRVYEDIVGLGHKKLVPKNCSLRLFGFCTATNGGFGLYPPFDLVGLVDMEKKKEMFTIPFDNLEFCLETFEP